LGSQTEIFGEAPPDLKSGQKLYLFLLAKMALYRTNFFFLASMKDFPRREACISRENVQLFEPNL
jgi:hypothetical protein